MDDSRFFEQHTGQKLNPNASPRDTTRPLISVHHEQSHGWLRFELIPWLSGTLGVTKASLATFQACVQEIFNNIKDHSGSDIGSVFVQHFPKENVVSISVADFGWGIPPLVRKVEPELNDAQALQRATQPGFTTQSTVGNKGAGLPYLLTTVVGANKGTVTIFSHSGHVLFYNTGNNIASQEFGMTGFCPGTTIDISFRTDTIEKVDEEPEDLEW